MAFKRKFQYVGKGHTFHPVDREGNRQKIVEGEIVEIDLDAAGHLPSFWITNGFKDVTDALPEADAETPADEDEAPAKGSKKSKK